MDKQAPSIFNDVIGPVMRGPSSSHVAAAARIGNIVRQLVNSSPKKVLVEFDKTGALAASYHGHGSDMGFVGGILNIDLQDEKIVNSLAIAQKRGIDIKFEAVDKKASHPSTYECTITSITGDKVHATAISVGGGMIEFQEIEGFEISFKGDFYETIFIMNSSVDREQINQLVEEVIKEYDYLIMSEKEHETLVEIKSNKPISEEKIENLYKKLDAHKKIIVNPVLPTISSKNCNVPFLNTEEMFSYSNKKDDIQLYELALEYESIRGNITKIEVFEKMREIVKIMRNSIYIGIEGTSYTDRILGPQSWRIKKYKDSKLVPGDVLNKVIEYITSMMEIKSSMGVIVAAPTAGACAALPGTIIGIGDALGLSEEELVKGMLAAGMIGIFVAEHATFAAEVGGCQVECGAGSLMAAAGVVQLMGGTAREAVDASTIAMQNVFGMTCDPVADRVEVPCLGKNVMAGTNAITCANMALAGYDKVIPFDETLKAFYEVGLQIHEDLRCTERGGLSITPTAKAIYKSLHE